MAADTLPELDDRTVQAITAAGIVLVSVGTVLDIDGIGTIVLAFGLALSLAGIVYLATPGERTRRYGLAVAALVAGQIALLGGTVGLVGLGGLLIVAAVVAWLSLQDD
ncbi:hypothetical protein [Natranaeroarchaeum sulfidigenes]|uniref:Uncharacterized protein n=1 Tax=Natranaeroarchaeum sulfidigenes TaxID=2784880 RepID=A0A897MP26_9EURY|nr:hypothetical protein [Natranaeroarchaeum sulfidigenes]QSG03920.1 hypothetical protein AArcS_2724 [Natranaeroarchaeum sulfidigenes]